MMTEGNQAGCAMRLVAVLFVSLVTACSHVVVEQPDLADLEPLQVRGQEVDPVFAPEAGQNVDLLALSPEMTDFADRYVRTGRTRRQRLMSLHRSLRSAAFVGIRYEPNADGSAIDAFRSGEANCLSYAHLFVALARYSGLDARYQSLTLRPEWARHGDRVAIIRHVNVLVKFRNGEEFMVDIDPVERERVARVDVLADSEARALHDNNLAMNALLDEDLPRAYRSVIRALKASPAIDYLWVNLGAIYRSASQDAAAERSYLHAIALNPNSRSAMNNLMVLYAEQGKTELASQWTDRVSRHRARNPYYHASLGDLAEEQGEMAEALVHYREALDLADTDAELYFRVGKIYLALAQPEEAAHYVRLAIKHARLYSERSAYQAWLDRLEGGALASLDQSAGRTRM